MARKFSSAQLLEAEIELLAVQDLVSEVGIAIGEHADCIHFDGVEARSGELWIAEIYRAKNALNRAEGLIRAYNIHVNGEIFDDNACAG